MDILLRWLINALVLIGIAYLVPGIRVASLYSALIAAFVLGLVNALIRPILIILTLPINIITLGLFTLVINAALFYFVSTVVKGFEVRGFWPAFVGALFLWVASWLTNALLRKL